MLCASLNKTFLSLSVSEWDGVYKDYKCDSFKCDVNAKVVVCVCVSANLHHPRPHLPSRDPVHQGGRDRLSGRLAHHRHADTPHRATRLVRVNL